MNSNSNNCYMIIDTLWASDHFATVVGFFVQSVVALVYALVIKWYGRNAQVHIEDKGKKIEYTIQRKYMLTEIRVKHLLEIYPDLHAHIHKAGSALVALFETVLRKVEESNSSGTSVDDAHICTLLHDYYNINIANSDDRTLENLASFSNCIETSSLFISDSVKAQLLDLKKEFQALNKICREEILSGSIDSYTRAQLEDLLKRAEKSLQIAIERKNTVTKQMNRELDPNIT